MRRTHKQLTFHEDYNEPPDSEFLQKYQKCTKSSWFALMFLMACLPTYCRDIIIICTTASHDIELTCLVPHLINKMHWNLSSMRTLTMPQMGRICSYLDYNYSIFDNMKPEEAYQVKARLRKPVVKECSVRTSYSDHSFRNFPRTLLKSCSGISFKNNATQIRNLFAAGSYIICGILGDIFGRKIIFIACLFIFIIGSLLSPKAPSFYLLIAGFSIEGVGIAGLITMNYVIFAELCSKDNRGILTLYITLFGAVAKLCGYMVKSYVLSYVQTCYLFALPTSSMLLYVFFVPESPRWLLSYGKKKRAWKILKNWGEDISQYTFLPERKLNKFRVFTSNLDTLFRITKYRRTILIMTWIKFTKIFITTNLKRYINVGNIGGIAHKTLLLMAEMISFFVILPPFMLFGRYITLFCMIFFGLICLIISLFIEGDVYWYMINILSAQYLHALDYIVILYSLELLPTSARASGFGLIWGAAEGLAAVGKLISQRWVVSSEQTYIEIYIMISGQCTAIILMVLLPNIRVGELPDRKRYRSEVKV